MCIIAILPLRGMRHFSIQDSVKQRIPSRHILVVIVTRRGRSRKGSLPRSITKMQYISVYIRGLVILILSGKSISQHVNLQVIAGWGLHLLTAVAQLCLNWELCTTWEGSSHFSISLAVDSRTAVQHEVDF